MPKAEVGSTKHLANKMKAKGLQRLRWYCQACEKQCRDENGFKCHTQSESHVRQMMIVGSDPRKAINEFSQEFEKAFLQQLKTAHGTKQVQINHFYQEYIANKEHVHMNATKWHSLTDFAKYLGQQGICRVEETEKGIHVTWIDNSPDALRRQDAIKKRERMERGDEEREQRQIQEQVKRAQALKSQQQDQEEDEGDEAKKELQRTGDEKIKLKFGSGLKTQSANPTPPPQSSSNENLAGIRQDTDALPTEETERAQQQMDSKIPTPPAENATAQEPSQQNPASSSNIKVSLSGLNQNKPKNVFAMGKKSKDSNKRGSVMEPQKKMSEAERIMKEELERKKRKSEQGGGGGKKIKLG
ncbi:MAG: hypothetical protein M1831_002036 [Alyxoria varia]|nr:MAG: hypothetical protein M1831_002036 [Alyxoria varia]